MQFRFSRSELLVGDKNHALFLPSICLTNLFVEKADLKAKNDYECPRKERFTIAILWLAHAIIFWTGGVFIIWLTPNPLL